MTKKEREKRIAKSQAAAKKASDKELAVRAKGGDPRAIASIRKQGKRVIIDRYGRAIAVYVPKTVKNLQGKVVWDVEWSNAGFNAIKSSQAVTKASKSADVRTLDKEKRNIGKYIDLQYNKRKQELGTFESRKESIKAAKARIAEINASGVALTTGGAFKFMRRGISYYGNTQTTKAGEKINALNRSIRQMEKQNKTSLSTIRRIDTTIGYFQKEKKSAVSAEQRAYAKQGAKQKAYGPSVSPYITQYTPQTEKTPVGKNYSVNLKENVGIGGTQKTDTLRREKTLRYSEPYKPGQEFFKTLKTSGLGLLGLTIAVPSKIIELAWTTAKTGKLPTTEGDVLLRIKKVGLDSLLRTPAKAVSKEIEKYSDPTLLGSVLGGAKFDKPWQAKVESAAADIALAAVFLGPKRIPLPLKIAKLDEQKIIVVGYGTKIKEVATITGGKIERGFDITKIGKEGFKKIAKGFDLKGKSGAEIDVLGKTESAIITSKKNLAKLQQAGILSKEDVTVIKAGKMIVKDSAKLPNKTLRDLGGEPWQSVKGIKESLATKEFFREQKIVLGGSSIDIATFPKRFVGKAGDFDVTVKSIAEGERLASAYVIKLKPVLNPKTEFVIKSSGQGSQQILRYESGKYAGKVGEFIYHKDPSSGQIAQTGKVLGVKTETKTTKVEGIKMPTGKFQINRRIAQITSMQPTEEGIKISPPMNIPGTGPMRVKAYPQSYAGTLARAAIARKKGQIDRALRLERAAADIKEVGEKYIDFETYFKSRAYSTMKLVQETKPKPIEQLSSSLIKKPNTPLIISQLSSGVSKPINTQSPTSIISELKESPPSSRSSSLPNLSKSVYNKSVTPSFQSAANSFVSSASKPNIKSASRPSLTSRVSSYGTSVLKSRVSGPSTSLGSISKGSSSRPSRSSRPSGSPGYGGSPGSPGAGSPGIIGSSSLGLGSGSGRSGPSGFGRVTIPPKIPLAIFWKTRISEGKPSPRYRRVDFLGGTRVAEISGFRTKKKDFDYGKKTQRLFDEDLAKTKKKHKSMFMKSKKRNVLF